jgi:glycosyltransferase involved in cell wall biosynthesis
MKIKTISILIATTVDRRESFWRVYNEFRRQIDAFGVSDYVKIIYLEDNKEMSIGVKRQLLLEKANTDYIVFFDSDDIAFDCYVQEIYKAIQWGFDCVGFEIKMTTNGEKEQVCCHSLSYPEWTENVDGYDYVRNVTHFNPVKRELALQVGFEDIRFGEDFFYSNKLTPLCKSEIRLYKKLFHYDYKNDVPHEIKYGIVR